MEADIFVKKMAEISAFFRGQICGHPSRKAMVKIISWL